MRSDVCIDGPGLLPLGHWHIHHRQACYDPDCCKSDVLFSAHVHVLKVALSTVCIVDGESVPRSAVPLGQYLLFDLNRHLTRC